MEELEKTARELILAITEKTLKSLKDKGILKEPSKLQMLCSSPEMKSLIKKLSAPKYDPCRPFRQGDKVRPVERYGRKPDDGAPVNVICEVVEDELKNGTVAIRARENCGSVRFRVTALYLELITPVEEVEPYFIMELKGAYGVYNTRFQPETEVCHFFTDMHPNAKAAAEAERDRLNAEWRKENAK